MTLPACISVKTIAAETLVKHKKCGFADLSGPETDWLTVYPPLSFDAFQDPRPIGIGHGTRQTHDASFDGSVGDPSQIEGHTIVSEAAERRSGTA
jgi:hypothetical protein